MILLLKTCLRSLSVLLEIYPISDHSESIKLIEEILQYLLTFMNFTPRKCVICIKQLLKFMFAINYISIRYKYECLLKDDFGSNKNVNIVFEYLRGLKNINESGSEASGNEASSSTRLTAKPTAASSDTKSLANSNIKLFEPIVIQCLKVRFKQLNRIITLHNVTLIEFFFF